MTTNTPSTVSVESFIAGQWVQPEGTTVVPCIDPNSNMQRTKKLQGNDGANMIPSLLAVRDVGADQIEQAIAAANSASKHAHWVKTLSFAQRYNALMKAADLIEKQSNTLAELECVETGVPISETKLINGGLAPCIRSFLDRAMQYLTTNEKFKGAYGHHIHAFRVAQSPAVIIAPWNVPCGTIVPKLLVALLCGCCVIVKPSEFASSSIVELIRMIHEAGTFHPPQSSSAKDEQNVKREEGTAKYISSLSCLQVLTGAADVGKALTSDRRIRCVQFTGAPATGMKIAVECAARLCPLLAECGGSNTAIVHTGCLLDHAVECIARGITQINGQWCMGVSRVLVQNDLQAMFTTKLIKYLNDNVLLVDSVTDYVEMSLQEETINSLNNSPKKQHSGMNEKKEEGVQQMMMIDPSATLLPATDPNRILIGPMSNSTHADTLRRLIAEAGGTPIECGGLHRKASLIPDSKIAEKQKKGRKDNKLPPCFISPTILIDANHDFCAKTEFFGPIASIHGYTTLGEAVELSNQASGQLSTYVFMDEKIPALPHQDPLYIEVFEKQLREIQCGMIMVNSVNFAFESEHPESDPHAEFVGTAGVGVDGNGEALAKFFSFQSLCGVNGPTNNSSF